MLKYCAAQLSGIFCSLFQRSMNTQVVPLLWKTAVVNPLPKVSHPSSSKDYRPIALTSLVVKSLEQIIKTHIMNSCRHALDPLQFAYRLGRGTDDAIVVLLNYLYTHLEGCKTHARILFADFSSAFNTIHPQILANRLRDNFQLNSTLIKWILDFLSGRPQRVRVGNTLSGVRFTSVGTPQGSVLSPLLYILYTDSCRSSYPGRYIIKFADDTAVISLLERDETEHGPVLHEFVDWCEASQLHLNTSKTKELVFDFRHGAPSPTPTLIKGEEIEMVTEYKYLGLIIDCKLSWDQCADAVFKKGQQRLYFLRKLNYFNVDNKMLSLFYKSFIESILSYCIVCWYGHSKTTHRNKLGKIVKTCGRIIGKQQVDLYQLYLTRLVQKADKVCMDTTHPLSVEFKRLPSGRRYRYPKVRTNRAKNSFIPMAITQLNNV